MMTAAIWGMSTPVPAPEIGEGEGALPERVWNR
jgi:hypothetical protein